MGIIVIRVLAGGALSGTEERHPLGSPPPAPIGSGADYRRDVERARRFEPLVREGHADSLIEAVDPLVIAQPAVSTVLVGYSTMEHLEYAVAFDRKGPAVAGRARPHRRNPARLRRRAAVNDSCRRCGSERRDPPRRAPSGGSAGCVRLWWPSQRRHR